MRVARAPGRVNLIGDHTDYNDGFVLPIALDLATLVRFRIADDRTVRLSSSGYDTDVQVAADGSTSPADLSGWGRYAAAVVATLARRGRAPVGIVGEISSTVPPGSGLSSSAALEVALALALCDAAGFRLPTLDVAKASQEAELLATGVPCGIMDQLISLEGRAGHALLIDCRDLSSRPIPLPSGAAFVVVHSGMPRALADSAYAERRRACEDAAARIGVRALRDATPDQVADDPYARHVVSENGRVVAAARALAEGDLELLGRLMHESHRSLRDDFGVSTPELDELVGALERAGALGARLTGAGFGGCVVAVAPEERAEAIAERASADYRAATGREPTILRCRASDGAEVASPSDPTPAG